MADSVVAITVTRNLVATAFVFAIEPWIEGIGMKNVFVMLGVLIAVILASVFVFIFFGRKFRVMSAPRYRKFSAKQFDSRGTAVAH